MFGVADHFAARGREERGCLPVWPRRVASAIAGTSHLNRPTSQKLAPGVFTGPKHCLEDEASVHASAHHHQDDRLIAPLLALVQRHEYSNKQALSSYTEGDGLRPVKLNHFTEESTAKTSLN